MGGDGTVSEVANGMVGAPATDLAMLTICADAISASRPGARRDTLTTYLQRLTGADPVLEWVTGTALRPIRAFIRI